MRWILVILFCLSAVVVIQGRHYAGGRRNQGHNDDTGIYCNYYTMDNNGFKSVGSILCRYGCCGTIDDQLCCDNDDSDDDDDDDSSGGGRSVTFVLTGILGMAVLATLLSCAYWYHKKSRAKRCKTCHSDRPRTAVRVPGRVVRNNQRTPATVPTAPKHSIGSLSRAQIYSLFTIPTTPPAYSYQAPPQPPAYELPDPPPYSPKRTGDKDDLDMRSPPPPYS